MFATVYNWVNVNECKCGRTSTEDECHAGRPVKVTSPERIDKIHDLVLSDRGIKVRRIVEATGISQSSVFTIFHKKLGVQKSRQEGCRICSQRRINTIMWSILRFWRFRRGTGSEEGEDGEIGRQGDGHEFLGSRRTHLCRLLGKRTNDNWRVLCVVITTIERRNQEETSSFEKEKDPLPSRQCTGAHLRSFDGQIYRIKIRIITTSTGFGPQ